MVGAAGFEPARPFGQWGLSPSRLTKVTPRPRTIHSNYDYAKPGLLPMSNDSDSDARQIQAVVRLEAPGGFEPPNNGFAVRCLTTWLRRRSPVKPAHCRILARHHPETALRRRAYAFTVR